MAVHIYDAEDSDGDSWMEVVEGSPGPSMQNSKASLIHDRDDKAEFTRRTASWVADDSWVREFEEEYEDVNRDYDAGRGSSTNAEALTLDDSAKDKAQHVDPHHLPHSAHSQFDQELHLDHPEVGDIKRHFNEVQTIATAQPRKGLYYRLWLCWMYRMEWAKIEHMVQNAPNHIIQVVNYWFGLRNHPFWTASDKCPYQWYAMYGACLNIWKLWDQQNTDVGDDSDRTMTQESFRKSAIDRTHRDYGPPSASQIAARYPTFHGRFVVIDSIRPDSSITLQPHDHIFTTPCQVGGDLALMLRTYKSFCRPDQTMQVAIPFQTWIHWIHQVNLQPSAKHWAGHDLWPSNSPSTAPLSSHLPFQVGASKSVGDVAYEYVRDIGLPYKAAAYYQSVSYI